MLTALCKQDFLSHCECYFWDSWAYRIKISAPVTVIRHRFDAVRLPLDSVRLWIAIYIAQSGLDTCPLNTTSPIPYGIRGIATQNALTIRQNRCFEQTGQKRKSGFYCKALWRPSKPGIMGVQTEIPSDARPAEQQQSTEKTQENGQGSICRGGTVVLICTSQMSTVVQQWTTALWKSYAAGWRSGDRRIQGNGWLAAKVEREKQYQI